MEAIEFVGKKAAKGMIRVPKEIAAQLHDEFRVIILQDTPISEKKIVRKKRTLSAVKIKTKGFKFSREEANAR
jgi:hypothetical protein